MSLGAFAGFVIAIIAVVVVCIVCGVCFWRKREEHSSGQGDGQRKAAEMVVMNQRKESAGSSIIPPPELESVDPFVHVNVSSENQEEGSLTEATSANSAEVRAGAAASHVVSTEDPFVDSDGRRHEDPFIDSDGDHDQSVALAPGAPVANSADIYLHSGNDHDKPPPHSRSYSAAHLTNGNQSHSHSAAHLTNGNQSHSYSAAHLINGEQPQFATRARESTIHERVNDEELSATTIQSDSDVDGDDDVGALGGGALERLDRTHTAKTQVAVVAPTEHSFSETYNEA